MAQLEDELGDILEIMINFAVSRGLGFPPDPERYGKVDHDFLVPVRFYRQRI